MTVESSSLRCAFERGQKFHARKRKAERQGMRVKQADIYLATAEEAGVSFSQIKNDAKFAAAVQAVVKHCGKKAGAVLLDGGHNLSTRQIEGLSRKAPAMQRAQIESLSETGRLRAWPTYSSLVNEAYPADICDGKKGPSPKLVEDMPPVETWDFQEAINRLNRAAGLIAKNVIDLPRLQQDLTSDLRCQLVDGLAFMVRSTELLRAIVTRPSDRTKEKRV